MGTSDVLFGVTAEPKPNAEEGSILIHPLDFQTYMIMLVFKNGSATRNNIKDFVITSDFDWTKFNAILEETPVGNNGCISFYYLVNNALKVFLSRFISVDLETLSKITLNGS